MKTLLNILFIFSLAVVLIACNNTPDSFPVETDLRDVQNGGKLLSIIKPDEPEAPFEGIIAIVTNTID